MTRVTARYRITTPMFCSGADQGRAELRMPSFKGVLRFWWRSLMWRHCQRVEALRDAEGRLFGSTDHGQAACRMRLRDVETEKVIGQGQLFEHGRLEGANYLGYGAISPGSKKKGTRAGELVRPMIPGGEFSVELMVGRTADLVELENALILVGTVGGLGSKARKGFGSLRLLSLETDGQDRAIPDQPADRLRALGAIAGPDSPEWTAWSPSARVAEVKLEDGRPLDLLDALGREQVHYRGWGRHGKVLGQPSEKNFQADHDLSKGKSVAINHPRRVAFGLPHNYGKGDRNEVKPASGTLERRASPLFLHVDGLASDATPRGLVAFLPARFLPEGTQLRAFGRQVPLCDEDTLWSPVHGYVDRLLGSAGATSKKTSIQAWEWPID